MSQVMYGGVRSISDDDLCSSCAFCAYQPGELSACEESWPTQEGPSEYVKECTAFRQKDDEQDGCSVLILGFGMAREAVQMGYPTITDVVVGTEQQVREQFKGQRVALVKGAELFGKPEVFEFAVMKSKADLANEDGAEVKA